METEDVGLVHHPLDATRRLVGRAVEEHARDGRNRDTFDLGPLVVRKGRAVKEETRARASRARDGQVDWPGESGEKTPELRRRAVAQHGSGPGGKHSGHPLAQFRLEWSEPVHAPVEGMQPAYLHAIVDLRHGQAELEQLVPVEHPVLAARQVEDRPLDSTRATLTATIAVNVARTVWAARGQTPSPLPF